MRNGGIIDKADQQNVFVIVLNWNNWQDTLRCLDSLYQSDYENLTVVLCDNGSKDNSVKHVMEWATSVTVLSNMQEGSNKEDHILLSKDEAADGGSRGDSKLVIISIKDNLGYAAGNNVGISFALRNGADFIFILNNDAVVDKNCIANFMAFAAAHPDAALMAPTIFEPLPGTDEYVEISADSWAVRPAFRTIVCPSIRGRAFCKEALAEKSTADGQKLYYAPGCAMMFRSSCLQAVGLFDENTFLFYEEYIMAEKLKRAELATYYVNKAMVWHHKGASTQKIVSANKYIYSLVSEKYYLAKYYGVTLPQLAFLNILRTTAFVKRALGNMDYLSNSMNFFRKYYNCPVDSGK